MAAVSACFFTVTSTKTQSILFCRKPSSFILKYSRVHSFHSSKNLYTRRRSSAHLVRASLDVGVGVRAESDKLPSDVRKRAMDAVDALGRRVTVGDLASKAGLQLTEAQKALQALATDTNGFLEVNIHLFYRQKVCYLFFFCKINCLVSSIHFSSSHNYTMFMQINNFNCLLLHFQFLQLFFFLQG